MTTKIALVTGGSRGLGKEMALALARKGNDVILTYHSNKTEAENVVKEITALGQKAQHLQFDVADLKSINEFVANLLAVLKSGWNVQHFDFLVNNAGVGASIPIAQVTEENFDHLLNVHFKGVYFLTQKTISLINDHGCVINVSSGSTRFCVPGYSVYASMKGAIEIFTKYIAKEYGARGIRANVVAPGPIETDFNNGSIRNNPQMKAFLAAQSPLGRVGQADDVGGVVAFLCSADAKWINGQKIEVTGGINN